ncbi:hypothetical protein WA026_001646 [Henosepilachna vigintioctopunctata]|uniref:Uncharacterized protein n=1 Tax=Henosepilachna vigintioctopunctata TaxID=420089 RepID=A0AAW1UV72_9CUCU
MAAVTIKKSEISSHSVDSVTARREARRRKILENAESRLKKLTGVEQKSNVTIDDFRPIKYECHDTSLTQTNDNDDSLSYNGILPTQASGSTNLGSNISPELMQNGLRHPSKSTLIEKSSYKLLRYFVIAFFANVLLIFSNGAFGRNANEIGCNMIFVPFVGYEFVNFFINRENNTGNSILRLLLIFNMKSETLKMIILYIQYLTQFTQDLFVYFFMFIVANQMLKLAFCLR